MLAVEASEGLSTCLTNTFSGLFYMWAGSAAATPFSSGTPRTELGSLLEVFSSPNVIWVGFEDALPPSPMALQPKLHN